MANIRISQLPTPQTSITGTELVPIVQNGQTVQTTTGALNGNIVSTAAPTLASASTIAPIVIITFVSGTTAISTITPPNLLSSVGNMITLIPTGLWSTNTSGNIALGSTAVVGKALIMTYDTGTLKWYPSY